MTPEAPDESPIDLPRLARGLAARWRLVLGLGLPMGVALGLAATLGSHPRYEARIGLVKRTGHNRVSLDQEVVVQREELSMKTVAASVKTGDLLAHVLADSGFPGSTADLSRAISVENPRDTDLLRIEVTDDDPVRVVRIAESLLKAFLAEHGARAEASARDALHVLEARRESTLRRQRELDDARMALLAEHGFSDIAGERVALLEQRSAAETALVQARHDAEAADAALAEYVRQLGGQPEMVTFSTIEDAPLQHDLARLEVERAGAAQRFTAEHPVVADLDERIRELRARISSGQEAALREVQRQINPLVAPLALEVARARCAAAAAHGRVAALDDVVRTASRRVETLRSVERSLLALDRELSDTRELLAAYRDGIEEAQVILQSDSPPFSTVESPCAPTAPLPSRRAILAVGLGVLGFLSAGLVALVLELLDTRIRAPDELRRLGLSVVHTLPRVSGEGKNPAYTLAAQVLLPAGCASTPILVGLDDDDAPETLAGALSLAAPSVARPVPLRGVADAVLSPDWRDRPHLLVLPAGRIPRALVERYLRRARQLGTQITGAVLVGSPDTPFDTLSS